MERIPLIFSLHNAEVGRYMKEEEEEEEKAVRFVTQQSKPENDTATGSAERRGYNMYKDSACCGCCFYGFVTLFAVVVVYTSILASSLCSAACLC